MHSIMKAQGKGFSLIWNKKIRIYEPILLWLLSASYNFRLFYRKILFPRVQFYSLQEIKTPVLSTALSPM